MKILNNNLYISDESGTMFLNDIRKFDNFVAKKKICDEAITCFDFYNENLVCCSLDVKLRK